MYFKGKVVGDARYIHKDAITLIDPIEKTTVSSAAKLVEKNQNWNVLIMSFKILTFNTDQIFASAGTIRNESQIKFTEIVPENARKLHVIPINHKMYSNKRL